MKLHEFLMREAFASLDWKAVQKIMAQYFAAPKIMTIDNILAYSNSALPEVIIKIGGESFRWTEGVGFQRSGWAYDDCAYICYRSEPVLI